MSVLSENTTTTYGFKIAGEIDKYLLFRNTTFLTKEKTVDGMPSVKWSLKFCLTNSKDGIEMHISFDSAENVDWTISYSFYGGSMTKGSSMGLKEILLSNYPANNLFNPQYSSILKLPFEVQATFTYKSQSHNIPKISVPFEWGLRLQENSAEDFNILVDGQNFAVHKLIIAAESPVFKRMFEDDFKESRECKVTITDFESKIVETFVDYCYGRSISAFMGNESDEINLLYFSDKYDCKTLKPQLETHIASKLSTENISLLVSTSDKTNSLQLRKACAKFVQNLFINKQSLPSEVYESFDNKFKDEVLRQSLNLENA